MKIDTLTGGSSALPLLPTHSESYGTITSLIAQAQRSFPVIEKDEPIKIRSKKPGVAPYTYWIVSYKALVEHYSPLWEQGVAITHHAFPVSVDVYVCATQLTHGQSGEWVASYVPVRLSGDTTDTLGNMTRAYRGGLQHLLGAVVNDRYAGDPTRIVTDAADEVAALANEVSRMAKEAEDLPKSPSSAADEAGPKPGADPAPKPVRSKTGSFGVTPTKILRAVEEAGGELAAKAVMEKAGVKTSTTFKKHLKTLTDAGIAEVFDMPSEGRGRKPKGIRLVKFEAEGAEEPAPEPAPEEPEKEDVEAPPAPTTLPTELPEDRVPEHAFTIQSGPVAGSISTEVVDFPTIRKERLSAANGDRMWYDIADRIMNWPDHEGLLPDGLLEHISKDEAVFAQLAGQAKEILKARKASRA